MRYYLLLAVIALSACISPAPASVAINNVTVGVEVADTLDEWQRGLMFREALDEGSGMLFVFPDSATRSFWMKNTLIPLDIMFIDANLTIIDIQQMEPCRAEPCPSYISAAPARYALEVNKDFASRSGIATGDKVVIKLPGAAASF